MAVFDVDGQGFADHTIMVDTTGYVNGHESITTITYTGTPDSFVPGFIDRSSPQNDIQNAWGFYLRLHGDIELDAFRKGIAQLQETLDRVLGPIRNQDS